MPIERTGMYLPLSENTLHHLLDDASDLVRELQTLSLAQYTALLLIARLPELHEKETFHPEQFFAQALDIGQAQVQQTDLQSYIEGTHSLIGKSQIAEGLNRLIDFRIVLLDDKAIVPGEYLLPDGSWDFEFKDRHRSALNERAVKIQLRARNVSYLTTEQSRLYREFEAQSDEQIHVQGYAGTGKSTFIVAILKLLERSNAQVLLLAHTKKQLDALSAKADLNPSVHKKTFIGLAQQILPNDLTVSSHKNFRRIDVSRATMPDSQLIQLLGVHDSGDFSALEIIAAVRGALYRFCQSDNDEISEEHIPRRFKATFDVTTTAITCQHARALWRQFQTPGPEHLKPQVRGFHVIKWAALNRCYVPPGYTHILLDECHSLSESMLQILNNSPQALLTLGDEYQSVNGAVAMLPESMRKRELSHSVRSSSQIESIVNPIIAVHPGKSKSPFHGNTDHRIEIEYYKVAKVPDQSFVILVNEMWGLFEWAQRIAAENADIKLLSSAKDLDMFVQDCIELYNTGSRARHPELFRFNSWADVEKHNRNIPGFQRINRMLEKGFGYKDWQQTYSKFNNNGHFSVALDFIKNTLNHEFNNVMLTPGIFRGSMSDNRAEFCSILYVGVTRAKKKLVVPEALRHWIEEVSVN